MKLPEIKFENTSTQRVYKSYLKQVERAVKSLPKTERDDVLMEFNSHLFEGMQSNEASDEMTGLLDVIDKLGVPEIVLKPLVADKKLEQATRTFNPVHVFKAIMLNLTNGFAYIVFALLYLLLFGFVFTIFGKIMYPENVGMYFKDGSFQSLGWISGELAPGYEEVLGNWFIPVMILLIIVFYFIITLLLKLKRALNSK